jgi:hypothetical protein
MNPYQLQRSRGEVDDQNPFPFSLKTFASLPSEEWYSDRYLYHVIGFLLALDIGVPRVRKLARDAQSKTAFRESLKDEIFRTLFNESQRARSFAAMREFIEAKLVEMDYHSDRRIIYRLLLLFNIASLLENGGAGPWFPFNHFKKDHWDGQDLRVHYVSGKWRSTTVSGEVAMPTALERFLEDRGLTV